MTEKGEQQPKAAEKGKAVEEDAKPTINGQKPDGVIGTAEELSEEDLQLKNELDMLVERLMVSHNPQLAIPLMLILLRNPTRNYTNPRSKPSKIPSKPLHLL